MNGKSQRQGECVQCGGTFRLKLNGQPYAHKSGNPNDWYGQSRTHFITTGGMQPCMGEGLTALNPSRSPRGDAASQ